ncbi:Threonyl/alanyl tRNA synthetase SAD [Penicillium fimorum]|uniref:Threonyl/alanyl tRNA synthetase SAD n=1 Tax=Penicillium fimorum TaxID=1882269 RepID=A0A9W9XVF4_9EURO|nr:Threonyl/alanyl tRNA synthetase SAD [Penicillium fimorum]
MWMGRSYLDGTKPPKLSFVNGKWKCPDPDCSTTWASIWSLKHHYLALHMRASWPCKHAEASNCDQFFTAYEAKQHAEEHFPKCRKQSRVCALAHYKVHIRRGHFQDGEYTPLEVLNSLSGENIEPEDEPLAKVAEARDGDWERASEDEIDNSEDEESFEDLEPTAELAAWLGRLRKGTSMIFYRLMPC